MEDPAEDHDEECCENAESNELLNDAEQQVAELGHGVGIQTESSNEFQKCRDEV